MRLASRGNDGSQRSSVQFGFRTAKWKGRSQAKGGKSFRASSTEKNCWSEENQENCAILDKRMTGKKLRSGNFDMTSWNLGFAQQQSHSKANIVINFKLHNYKHIIQARVNEICVSNTHTAPFTLGLVLRFHVKLWRFKISTFLCSCDRISRIFVATN